MAAAFAESGLLEQFRASQAAREEATAESTEAEPEVEQTDETKLAAAPASEAAAEATADATDEPEAAEVPEQPTGEGDVSGDQEEEPPA
jgi:hypothetical protein